MIWPLPYQVYPVQPPANVYREAYVGEQVMNADRAEECYAKILAHAERTKALIHLILEKSDGPYEVIKALKEKVKVENKTKELFYKLDEILNEPQKPVETEPTAHTTPRFAPSDEPIPRHFHRTSLFSDM